MSTASATSTDTVILEDATESEVAEDVGESPTMPSPVYVIILREALGMPPGAKLEDRLIYGECVAEKERKERKEREAALERERAAAKANAEMEAALEATRALKDEREAAKAEDGDGADTGEAAEQVRHHLAVSSINGHEVGHKARVWTEKELAWLKVRQLLIEEEEKTSTHKRRHAKSVECSAVRSEASDGKSYNTVKLLYSLASYAPQPPQLFSFSSSRSRAEVEEQPPQIFASKLGQFLGAGSGSDNEITSSKSSRSLSEYSGNTPTRWQLLATLEQVTKTCQRMELSDATMARVSEHLNSIDQIVREDVSSHQSRSRRLLSTQAANDSSDSFDTYSVLDIPSSHPRADVAPTVRDSFKAFASGRDLRDTLAASNNLVADCGLDGVKLQEPWHVYYHIREENGGNLFYNIKTEPQIPVAEYTAVHGATGTNDTIAEPAGITLFVFSRDESLGIACYFLNLETTEEMKRKEFSWTTRLKHHMLDEMRDVGIDWRTSCT
ncbi:hypothetical protein GQ600_5620 [Phytophthora cactorum]|nr:hypothetical protein GQ600_5620 [Phytophthora cactorum]